MQTNFFTFSAIPQLVIDPESDKICGANNEACQLLGMDTPQLKQTAVSALFAPSFPHLIVFSDKLIHTGTGWCDHLILKSCDTEFRVEVQGRCVIEKKRIYLYLGFQAVDDLEKLRKKSDAHKHYLSGIGNWNRVAQVFQEFERENQLILDAVGEGIYGVDSDGITTFVNPAAERILGYSSEELAGRNMHSMIHHSKIDGTNYCVNDCPIFEAFRDGAVHTVEDDIFWSRDGSSVEVEYTSTPIRDNGFLVGAVIVFRDISQKKKDKKRLLEALIEVETLKNKLELENAYLQEELNSEFNHHQIIGKSLAVKNTVQQIQLVAPTEATVLIRGESGTGKELIARAIHEMSDRSHRPLVRVNCAAVPEGLFESEFFGHAKGSFTGAISDRPGRFEVADGGTLFLDEVGEIPLHLQSKLLRVLQEQQFERIGESKTRQADVRVIAATNRNLKDLVARGAFREDLYFRLNVFPIESAPLRQRKDDIPLLTQHFLQKICARANNPIPKISLRQLKKLTDYHWPGNIRELENVIERQVILSPGDALRFDELNTEIQTPEKALVTTGKDILTDTAIKDIDRRNLILALERCGGKVFGKNGAAALLEMKPTTLISRIKKYAIDTLDFKKTNEKNRAQSAI